MEIANEIRKLEPSNLFNNLKIHYEPVDNEKSVIVISVKSGDQGPNLYDGKPYLRLESSTSRMSKDSYENLLFDHKKFYNSWELESSVNDDINSLDFEEIKKTVEQGINANRIPGSAFHDSIEGILDRFELLRDKQLANAAIALYSEKISAAYFPQCLLKMVCFQGTDKLSAFIDNKEIYCNAFKILEEASGFIMKHIPVAGILNENDFQRQDKPAVPPLAVREALVNAICHRNYLDYSGAIELMIYNNRMEIWNNGMLPMSLSLDDLKKNHASIVRNKIISNVFHKRGFIDKWGTGTNRIISLALENGLPEPKFSEYSGGFSIVFYFDPTSADIPKSINQGLNLSPRQNEILQLLTNESQLSANNILTKLNKPPSLRSLQNDLLYLQRSNLIQQIGGSKNTVWDLMVK